MSSTEEIQSRSTGSEWDWCPVRASVKSMPLSRIMVWSNEPPRTEMSACAPLPPRSRMSTEGVRRRADSSVWTGAAAWALRSKSGVCDCALRAGAVWLPVTPTSRIRSVFMTAVVSEVCADAPCVASSRIDIPTASTPIVTLRRRLAKADQPLRFHRRQRIPVGNRRVWMCSISVERFGLIKLLSRSASGPAASPRADRRQR